MLSLSLAIYCFPCFQKTCIATYSDLLKAEADTMFDIIAGKKNKVILEIDAAAFPGADGLVLTELCDPLPGGGYYHLKHFGNIEVNRNLWLCDVTRFCFGIYLRRFI